MLLHGAANFPDDLARMCQRLFHQRRILDLLGHPAREQVDIRTPRPQRRRPARRRDIGVVEADRSAEDLQLARHAASTLSWRFDPSCVACNTAPRPEMFSASPAYDKGARYRDNT